MFWLHNTEQDMNWYDILKGDTREQLEANWREQAKVKGTSKELDYEPVCKLFIPWASGTWLLTELEPGPSLAFGLCDLGFGTPELGDVCLRELFDYEGPGGLRLEQDIHFKAKMTLRQYADHARRIGCVVI